MRDARARYRRADKARARATLPAGGAFLARALMILRDATSPPRLSLEKAGYRNIAFVECRAWRACGWLGIFERRFPGANDYLAHLCKRSRIKSDVYSMGEATIGFVLRDVFYFPEKIADAAALRSSL